MRKLEFLIFLFDLLKNPGIIKGGVGLVVKPVVGVSDAVTDVLQGIKGTTEQVFVQKQRGQVQ